METLYTVIRFFQSGGPFMYPILLVLAIGAAIAIERYIYLTFVRARNKGVWKRVLPLLESEKYDAAREAVLHSDAAVSKILSYGLNRAEHRGNSDQIQMAMEEGLAGSGAAAGEAHSLPGHPGKYCHPAGAVGDHHRSDRGVLNGFRS